MIYQRISQLTEYGINKRLIDQYDKTYIINTYLELLDLDEFIEEEEAGCSQDSLENILKDICDYMYEKKLLKENSIVYRDLLDTKLMGVLVPRPKQVGERFWKLYQKSPTAATEDYYRFCQDTDYIRRYRVCKDKKWKTNTEYGDLDITINLSKPEKDPKAIAAAKLLPQSGYPKCLLCKENEGYAGRCNHPARQNHRTIPVLLNNENWGFQYSPYVYYNEHCIVFNYEHIPMKISTETFKKLFEFVKQFPHYFVGSNADLPIVGGSILTHDHFQGGHYEFPMAKAGIEQELIFKGYESVEAGIVKWPMSVIRLKSEDTERILSLAEHILKTWRVYTDEVSFLYAFSDKDGNLLLEGNEFESNSEKLLNKDGSFCAEFLEQYGIEPHHTITPIARMREGKFELDLVLRDNITTSEHPLGVYHPHAELHHIKKENIGLIEVMGLAVLPSRLLEELELLKAALLAGQECLNNELLAKHAEWAEAVVKQYGPLKSETIDMLMEQEVGLVFQKVLTHAGVYKRDEIGKAAFLRFIETVNRRQ